MSYDITSFCFLKAVIGGLVVGCSFTIGFGAVLNFGLELRPDGLLVIALKVLRSTHPSCPLSLTRSQCFSTLSVTFTA